MEALSALLAFCAGNSQVTGEFPSQRPVTRGFDVFFDLRLNKLLSKQSWGLWVETPSRALWRFRNRIPIYRQTSNTKRILEGNTIIDHSDVVGASPVGAAPTTSSFAT